MSFLSEAEAHKVKNILSTAFNAQQLRAQVRQIDEALAQGRGDSPDAWLRQYKGILNEAIAGKAVPRPKADATMPSLKQLKRKFGVD